VLKHIVYVNMDAGSSGWGGCQAQSWRNDIMFTLEVIQNPKIVRGMLKGDLPPQNHFITLQIDAQSPNLFYSNYITKTEKSVASNDITNLT
jgi:hypothetical protein